MHLFSRLKAGLKRTREKIRGGLANLILGKKSIDAELFDTLEAHLLLADVGVDATNTIISDLTQRLRRKALTDPNSVVAALKEDLLQILKPCQQPLIINRAIQPYVILMIGVNGAGKTTTIGKLSKHFSDQGLKVLLAAGDTFRAAAIEQLQTWGERNQIDVIAQHTGADSASVIFDAIQAAKARQCDVIIADTAGRLHTQSTLMEELKKVKRVISKCDATAPHEIILVLDAGIGQNAINQAEQFHKAIGIHSFIVTKLDGTAKGGIVFALANQFKLPIRFIGVGEKLEDLRPFDANEYVEGLLFDEDQTLQFKESSH